MIYPWENGKLQLYAMICEGDITKVGISSCSPVRLKQLMAEKPSQVTGVLISEYFDTEEGKRYQKERAAHALLSGDRIKGEWFNCDLDRARQVIEAVTGKECRNVDKTDSYWSIGILPSEWEMSEYPHRRIFGIEQNAQSVVTSRRRAKKNGR